MTTLHLIGYWWNDLAPGTYPRPQALRGRWGAADRAAVLTHLRAGQTLERFPAASFCRFACGRPHTGTRLLTDGVWAWPEGLAHYVLAHAVQLPPSFIAHVRRAPPHAAPGRAPHLDDSRWRRWATRLGAIPDLDRAWQVPGLADRATIRRLLATTAPAKARALAAWPVVLARSDTRTAIFLEPGRLASPRLTAVRVTTGTTRTVRTWDAAVAFGAPLRPHRL